MEGRVGVQSKLPRGYLHHLLIIAGALNDLDGDPKSLIQAQKCGNWPKWKEVMDLEMATLEWAGTWCNVPCSQGKNIIWSKWVFRIKRKADRSIRVIQSCHLLVCLFIYRHFTAKLAISEYCYNTAESSDSTRVWRRLCDPRDDTKSLGLNV